MAGTSKRREPIANDKAEKPVSDEKLFRVGIYARLSVDHNHKKNESIDSQIAIAKKHISKLPNMKIVDIYSDSGATGTNFQRNDFQRLMSDIRQKTINCVVVKDFSRFGRNHIETGNYLEKIFPFMGVRFISVNDHYDSLEITDNNKALEIHLKHIVNELYARDIAVRVKSIKMTKLRQGSYIGAIPSYGYTIQKIGKKRVLFPEKETKDIVLQIYNFYNAGMGIGKIIKRLYEMKVHRPSEYRKTGHVFCQDGDVLRQWSETTLTTMLTNPVYTGTLIRKQGKTDHPVVIENAHEALIPKDLFDSVTAQLESHKKKKDLSQNHLPFHNQASKKPDIFSGILYCGECGHKLKRICTGQRQTGNLLQNRYVYGCPNIGRIDKQKCNSHHIPMKEIEKILSAALNKEFSVSHDRINDYAACNKENAQEKKRHLLCRQGNLKRQIDGIYVKTSDIYMEYRQKKITLETFFTLKQKLENQKMTLEKELSEIQMKYELIDQKTEQVNLRVCALIREKENMVFDTELVHLLIARIDVYAEKRVEIRFNFHAPVNDSSSEQLPLL